MALSTKDFAEFTGGGQTYFVGSTTVITGFDPARDVLDLGSDSIHNQIPVDTPDGFMMLHMFRSDQSLLLQGVSLADLHPENFAPIADGHLQQDLSAALAWADGSGLVRPNTIYLRPHEEGLQEIVDFDSATDKISFFYVSVRGDGKRNFAVEETTEGVRFFNPLSSQSLTLRDTTFADLDSSHFEWRANQLEDNIAGRMGLDTEIANFSYSGGSVFSGKSVAMAGLVDRAPYHSQPAYTGTPLSEAGYPGYPVEDTGSSSGDGSGGGSGSGGDTSGDITAGTATPVIESQWSTGFVAQVSFSPDEAVGSWTLQFEMNAAITNIWNAEIVSQEGNLYTIKNAGFNGSIIAGGEANFGFQAEGTNSTITFVHPEEAGGQTGTPGDNIIFGGDSDDTIDAGSGDDRVDAGDGNDTVSGGTGNDLLRGGQGNDILSGDAGADTLRGGAGNDNLRGEDGADVLSGSDGEDLLFGGAGNDLLLGDAQADVLNGGSGNDTLRGGGDNDMLFGDDDNDLLFGASGEDTLNGGDGDDTLDGGTQKDSLFGGNGNDVLRGGDGFDFLDGGSGNDILVGGNGNDTLVGGSGVDVLRGQANSDTFVFEDVSDSAFGAADLIDGMDGVGINGGDVIDLSAIDANTGLAGNNSFNFLGVATTGQGLSQGAGALWLEDLNGITRGFGLIDGDNTIDFAIRIDDGVAVTAADYTAADFLL